jgi:hypothetical protein
MIKMVEIYFDDLTSDAQNRLLNEFKTSREDENWDVHPLAIIEREIEDDEITYKP